MTSFKIKLINQLSLSLVPDATTLHQVENICIKSLFVKLLLRIDQPMLLNICLYIIIRTVMIYASCCARKDSGAQSNPKIVELRCRHDCLDSYGDFWIGGREGVGWSDGGRTIMHVVDLQRRPSATISTSMFVSKTLFKKVTLFCCQ